MGQLGQSLQICAKTHSNHTYFFTDLLADDPSLKLDITDREAVMQFVRENQIGMIINCAAYTNVDKAEDDEPTALKINADAVRNLAEAAAAVGAKMIHVSTDYVFDGQAFEPYCESDMVHPATAYGRTKLAGETALTDILPDAIIVRTAGCIRNLARIL